MTWCSSKTHYILHMPKNHSHTTILMFWRSEVLNSRHKRASAQFHLLTPIFGNIQSSFSVNSSHFLSFSFSLSSRPQQSGIHAFTFLFCNRTRFLFLFDFDFISHIISSIYLFVHRQRRRWNAIYTRMQWPALIFYAFRSSHKFQMRSLVHHQHEWSTVFVSIFTWHTFAPIAFAQ